MRSTVVKEAELSLNPTVSEQVVPLMTNKDGACADDNRCQNPEFYPLVTGQTCSPDDTASTSDKELPQPDPELDQQTAIMNSTVTEEDVDLCSVALLTEPSADGSGICESHSLETGCSARVTLPATSTTDVTTPVSSAQARARSISADSAIVALAEQDDGLPPAYSTTPNSQAIVVEGTADNPSVEQQLSHLPAFQLMPLHVSDHRHSLDASNNVFSKRKLHFLSLVQLACGLSCVVLEIFNMIFLVDYCPYCTGLIYVPSGVVGLIACRNPNKCKVISFMVLSIISAVFAVPGFSFSCVNADYYYHCCTREYTAYSAVVVTSKTALITIPILIAFFHLTELIAAIVSSALCCKAVCCGPLIQRQTVVYIAHPDGNTSANLVYSMPAGGYGGYIMPAGPAAVPVPPEYTSEQSPPPYTERGKVES